MTTHSAEVKLVWRSSPPEITCRFWGLYNQGTKDANFFPPIDYLIYIHILKKGGVAGSTLFRCGFPIFPLNPWSP